MCWHGVGFLIRLEGHFHSITYQRVLEEHMLGDTEAMIGEDFVFQQDNAPIHTSTLTLQWLREHDVILLEWPPKSPHANPIENLWHDLKHLSTIYNLSPQMSSGKHCKRRGSRFLLHTLGIWQRVVHDALMPYGLQKVGTLTTDEHLKGFSFPSWLINRLF